MKIKHTLEIANDNPFANCKLEREQYAKVLTDIVKAYEDGFVLAINNEWGTGKTTFLQMWQKMLVANGFQTIYFNAWENDFNNSPLVALMSELKVLTKGSFDKEKVFRSVIEKGAVLSKNIFPALAKSLVEKYVIDTKILTDAIENATKAATEILENEIKEYSDKKKTIAEFRSELANFIKTTETAKPLVFIVDELDRCRPDYAVELLEQLKHFFSVNGILFVLAIDKKHLASSVRGFYGSEQINTDEYLRRFIDLEYSIPHPSYELFSKYLFEYFELGYFFNSNERIQNKRFENDVEYLLKTAELLFAKSNATLRQQEKVFGQTRLILKTFKYYENTFSHVLFLLIYIKSVDSDLYKKIESNALTHQQLIDAVVNLMPFEIENKYGLNLAYVVALLLYLYNNNFDHQNRIELFRNKSEETSEATIELNIGASGSKKLERALQVIQKDNLGDINLKYLTNKINLTEFIK